MAGPPPDQEGTLPTPAIWLPQSSRYRRTLFYPGLSNAFGRWAVSGWTFPPKDTDVLHLVQPEEEFRLDLIAYRLYGTAYLWWVLAVCNGIRNPFLAPVSGETLRAPPLEQVVAIALGG